MNDRNSCKLKWRLLRSREFVPRTVHPHPAPEFFKTHVEYNLIHYLEKSGNARFIADTYGALDYVYTTLDTFIPEGMLTMPKNRQSNDTMPEMISSKLTDEELAQFDDWQAKNAKKVWDLLTSEMLDGVRVGVSWDGYNDCFIASFTGKGDKNVNTGRCLMSRSQDWQEAIAMNVFKHVEIYRRGKWENRNAEKQRG